MSYYYAVRGWLELSWPDQDIEGVDESPEQHRLKVQAIRDLLTARLSPEEIADPESPMAERYKGGWGFPQYGLEGTEYIFYGGDIEEPAIVLAQICEVLALDPFADGYFSIEGEDGEKYRQWLIISGTVYVQDRLFPDFEVEGPPPGFRPLFEENR